MNTLNARVSIFFMIIHLLISLYLPLFDDEAYYALWSKSLAPGYYDHPPMIAYMIRAGVIVFGDNTFGIRVVPIICFTIAGYLSGEIAHSLSGNSSQAAGLAAILFNLSIPIFALGSFATPDAPSTLFWVGATWAASIIIRSDGDGLNKTLWWASAGLMIGLGAISKFSNGFLAIGFLFYLVFTRNGRDLWRSGGPVLAAIFAIAPTVPYIIWNVDNSWIGFERQGSRLAPSDPSIYYLVVYIFTLFLAPTPFVTWSAIRALRRLSEGVRLLIYGAAPMTLFFAAYSIHSPVQPNWIAPLQFYFAILAACYISGKPRRRHLQNLGIITAGITSVGLTFVAFNPFRPISLADNPTNQVRGWTPVIAQISDKLDATNATWIATTDYETTGMLAALFSEDRVWSIDQLYRYEFRGEFPIRLCTENGLLVTRKARDETSARSADSYFAYAEDHGVITRKHGEIPLMVFDVFLVSGVLSSPLCPPQSDPVDAEQ